MTLRILEVLKVKFDDVARPQSEDNTGASTGGLGAKRPTKTPENGGGSATMSLSPSPER